MSLQDGTSATAARPRDEYNAAAWDAGALMPMVAVAAAKWRVAAIRRKGVPEAEVFEEEDKGNDRISAMRECKAATGTVQNIMSPG